MSPKDDLRWLDDDTLRRLSEWCGDEALSHRDIVAVRELARAELVQRVRDRINGDSSRGAIEVETASALETIRKRFLDGYRGYENRERPFIIR